MNLKELVQSIPNPTKLSVLVHKGFHYKPVSKSREYMILERKNGDTVVYHKVDREWRLYDYFNSEGVVA